MALVDQQVVSLDHHDPRTGLDGDLTGDAFVDLATEARREHGVPRFGAEAMKQCEESPAVESVDRGLCGRVGRAIQGGIGEVEAVHRQDRGRACAAGVQLGDDGGRERGLPAARTARDPEEEA